MKLKPFAIAYAVTAVVFLALDAVWLTLTADRLYRPALAHLMLDRFEPLPAAVFYALYFVGVVVFVIAPALANKRWRNALGLGALFGLVAYGTYDLTNQATLRDWPWSVTLADLCWGTFATAVAASVATRLALRWTASRIARR